MIHVIPQTVEPPVNADIEILFEDDGLLVVNKPAPLPMHPCGRFNRNSLQYILEQLIHPLRPRPVHRLDSNTSGVVVFAKMRKIATGLQPQFENGAVTKRYVAKVHGHPAQAEFESTAAISKEPTATGGRAIDPDGLPSHTKFKILERRDDGTSLVECFPVTGRTNQIRVHLWDLNHPVVGDPMYLPGKTIGDKQTLEPGDPPLCLHAASIEFEHPTTCERMTFESTPKW
jgi:RluA family pseudouridine synthase